MKNLIRTSAAIVCMLCMLSCASGTNNAETGTPSTDLIADAPVVGTRTAVGEDSLVVISLDHQPETITIRASDLVDDLRIVKLESTDDAIVGPGKVWTNGRRIIIYANNAVKQFDTDGKYLGEVGRRGNCPGGFTFPYYISIDEEAGRIYMMTYGARNIICYGLDGKYIGDIPLAHVAQKGFMKVNNSERTATVAALVFSGVDGDDVVWTQDFDGNILSSVKNKSVEVIPDFSNEIYGGTSTLSDEFDYSLFNAVSKADTLYHYADGRLLPEMTVDFGTSDIPAHDFRAFPGFYIVTTYGSPENVAENSYIFPAKVPFVVDKRSLRGAPVKLMLDNIGTVTVGSGWQFQESPDYFVLNYGPDRLLSSIEKAPAEHPLATEEGLRRMNELKESITDEDNNYIVIGRWKRP
ncbi:MAG: 6-bladed beta-propeller [Clostridium sp.]|nr:6-bladed beta-propeller [Clostridium sp.]